MEAVTVLRHASFENKLFDPIFSENRLTLNLGFKTKFIIIQTHKEEIHKPRSLAYSH